MITINYPCEKDRIVYRVPSVDPDIRILSVVLSCPRCQEALTPSKTWQKGDEEVVLSAQDLFKASNGLPISGLEAASAARIGFIFSTCMVVDSQFEAITEERVLLESLTVQTPTGVKYKLHFGSSTKGATIYKITRA